MQNGEYISDLSRIQGFGALIATDRDAQYIEYASENCGAFFQRPMEAILGGALNDLVGADTAHDIRNVLTLDITATQREQVCTLALPTGAVKLSVHRRGSNAVLEMLPSSAGQAQDGRTSLDKLHFLIGQIRELDDIASILEVAADELRVITGFDRIVAYRLMPDGTGEAVAEARKARADSFLGHSYPPDILAREHHLYRALPLLVIADTEAEDRPLSSHDERPALDMSLALLRGKSPGQVGYLAERGIRSAMVLSVVIEDELWGMFTFHHLKPRILGPDLLMLIELAAKFISMEIERKLH